MYRSEAEALFEGVDVGEVFDNGYEWRVSSFKVEGEEYVVKEVNPYSSETREGGEAKLKKPEVLEYLRSERHLRMMEEDYKAFKEIFGDAILDTMFVRATDRKTGEPTNYLFQKKLYGVTLKTIASEIKAEQIEEYVTKNRDQLLQLVWGAKEVFVKYGIPPDFFPQNLFEEASTGKIYFIDPGFVREPRESVLAPDTSPEVRADIVKHCLSVFESMDAFERGLKVTASEREALNNRPGHVLDERRYFEQREAMKQLQAKTEVS